MDEKQTLSKILSVFPLNINNQTTIPHLQTWGEFNEFTPQIPLGPHVSHDMLHEIHTSPMMSLKPNE